MTIYGEFWLAVTPQGSCSGQNPRYRRDVAVVGSLNGGYRNTNATERHLDARHLR